MFIAWWYHFRSVYGLNSIYRCLVSWVNSLLHSNASHWSVMYIFPIVIPHLIYHVYNEDWVPKRLMKLYVDFCTKLSEAPNKKLLKKLYNLEVSLLDLYHSYLIDNVIKWLIIFEESKVFMPFYFLTGLRRRGYCVWLWTPRPVDHTFSWCSKIT